jgi:uroporphyrinogen decarboxylase
MTADLLLQKDAMSPPERLKAIISGAVPDRVPFSPSSMGFAARVHGIPRAEVYQDPDKAFSAGISVTKAYPWFNFRPTYGWAGRGPWDFGAKIVWPDGKRQATPVCPEPLITEPDHIDSLPDPDPTRAGIMPNLIRFNRMARERGLPASLPSGTPTGHTVGLIGHVRFLEWLYEHPDEIHKLQRKVTDFIKRAADEIIQEHGGENCSLFCAVPLECKPWMRPKTFEDIALPYIKEILGHYLEAGLSHVIVHLCGDHTDNLEYWSDMPLPKRTVFSIGHEMDLKATGEAITSDHILAGNISCSLLAFGKPEEVYNEAKQCIRVGKEHDGGFILMPACEFPPDTPDENIDAVARAVYECGYY